MKNKLTENKKVIIFLAVVLIFAVIFAVHLFKTNKVKNTGKENIKKNIAAVNDFDFSNVEAVENQLKAAGYENSESKTDYRKIFNGSVVIGDSITEGLVTYKFLGEDEAFTEIGASVMKSRELFEKAAKTYPKNAFFSFGTNDIGMYNGDMDAFIKDYKKLLKDFHKTSPDTKIYICSIAGPDKSAIENNKNLAKYKEFNSALKKMAKDSGYKYIDTTPILAKNKDLYEGDGIHVKPAFYPLWLDLMIKKAGMK